jgi:hypothetical protein
VTNAISGFTITAIIDPLHQSGGYDMGYVFKAFDPDLCHTSQK